MKINYYDWQERAYSEIKNKDCLISSPTGTGKTMVAYLWAGILRPDGFSDFPRKKVIFTAPIKALSNERYMSLKNMGLDVGIETGDFKKNSQAGIICCTQEIYTLKYANKPNQMVIIDEIHYIFNNGRRSRKYIDGIKNTHESSRVMIMSATFSEPKRIQSYLKKLTGRDFFLFENYERMTDLEYMDNGIRPQTIQDSIVFVFSKRGVIGVSNEIASFRSKISNEKRERIESLANVLEVCDFPQTMNKGIGRYYGSMLPKEKMFTELCYRNGLVDVVVGTDALSLGVNLPAKYVIFAQIIKYIGGPISKNEFLQISGRAGRKGFFDTGYVSYFISKKKSFERKGHKTGGEYRKLLRKEMEPACIDLCPDFSKLIINDSLIKEESDFVSKFSIPKKTKVAVNKHIKTVLFKIKNVLNTKIKNKDFRKKIRETMSSSWDCSLSVEDNIDIGIILSSFDGVDIYDIVAVYAKTESNRLGALLRSRCLVNGVQMENKVKNMDMLDREIIYIDCSVFEFEEKHDACKEVIQNAPVS